MAKPMAGVLAAAPVFLEKADAPSVSAQPLVPAVRKYFPETWIWNCVDTGFVSLISILILIEKSNWNFTSLYSSSSFLISLCHYVFELLFSMCDCIFMAIILYSSFINA